MIEQIKEFLFTVANTLLSFLPESPFQTFLKTVGEIPALGYLNYFVPVAEMVVIAEAWLAAIAVFYLYQLVLRWVKMIE